jgi:HlyD family secretion protein
MSKKKKILIGIAALIVIACVVLFFKSRSKVETAKIQAEFATVSKGDINTIVTATGKIQPLKEVEVGTQVSGVVENVYVDYNSHVTAGQLIAELDKTNLKSSLADAKASLKNAINEQNYLQKIFERQKALFESKLISEADYDQALYQLENAKSTVVQRTSSVERAETNLAYASIYSPISGVVLSKAVELGQTVAASFSTPTLFTIAQDLSEMQVEANVDEADIGQVKEGQRVTFTVDSYLGEIFEGKVTQVRLNATVTSNVVTYTVIIVAKNPGQKLMPGMTATISIYTTELRDVLTLPIGVSSFSPDMALMMQYAVQQGNQPMGMGARPQMGDSTKRGQMFNREGARPGGMGDSNRRFRPDGQNGATMAGDSAWKNKPIMVWVKRNNHLMPQRVKFGASNEINIQVESGLNIGDSVLTSLNTDVLVFKPGANMSSSQSPFMPSRPGQRRSTR